MSNLPTHNRRNGRDRDLQPIKLTALFDKLPPFDLEAEMALLGSLLLDGQFIGEVSEILNGPADFYKPAHAAVYEAIVALWDKNAQLDIVQLRSKLADSDQLELVGGVDYLIKLAEAVPSANSAAYYAKRVRDRAKRRGLIEIAGIALHEAYTTDTPTDDLAESLELGAFNTASKSSQSAAVGIGQVLQDAYTALEKHDGKVITGLETGFFEVDEMLCGLQPGDMIVIGARPSMGKTALMQCMAEHIACDSKQPAAIFSLEMGKQQLGMRLMSGRSGVDAHKLRRNMLSPDDWRSLQLATEQATDAPLYIDDTAGISVMQLRARARRMAARYHLKAIFIDYLQLMSAGGRFDSREQEVSAISRGIKALAKELLVPVVVLSQLNRQSENRSDKRPQLSDLRESGSIEQDADVVMLLHREDYYHKDDTSYQQTNIADLIIAKQRNGPCGTVKLQFSPNTTRFHNLCGNPDPSFWENRQ